MLRKLFLPLLTLSFLLWTVGCSDNPSTPEINSETPNLNDDFGGYTATDDEPGFGDPELLASENDEEDVTDELLGTREVDSIVADIDAGMFHFRAIWGRLCYDSTVKALTDWTGSLTISRGAEIVRKVIRFERGQDYIKPRTDRRLIEWVSFTSVHNDGIGVDIFIPRVLPVIDTTYVVGDQNDTTIVIDTLLPEPVAVTFETGPYSRTFSLDELAALDTTVILEDGNAVAFYAVPYYRTWCARGFLAGHWGFDSTGQGVFRGMWMSHRGYLDGWLKGNFGVNEQGQRVFFGKWIDRSGKFEGFLKGTYRPIGMNNGNGRFDNLRKGGGAFEGNIFNAEQTEIGVLKGRYFSAPHFRISYFQGRWKLYCPEEFKPDSMNFADGF